MAVHINFSLTRYLVNVLKALRDKTGTGQPLDGVKVIKMYPLGDLEINDLPLPAILVDLYEIEPDPDAALGTGQLGVQLMMQLWVVVAGTEKGAPLTVRKLALNAGAIIHDGRSFGAPVGTAMVTDIIGMPKLRDETNRQYIIWSVEWQHATVISPDFDDLCDDPPVDADEINELLWASVIKADVNAINKDDIEPDAGPKRYSEGDDEIPEGFEVGDIIPKFDNEGNIIYQRNPNGEFRRDANGDRIPEPEGPVDDEYEETEYYYHDDEGDLIRDADGEPIRVRYDYLGKIIPYETYKILFGGGA